MLLKNWKRSLRILSLISPIFLVILFSSCFLFDQNKHNQISSNADEQTFTISEPSINLAQPLEISKEPRDIIFCDRIKEIVRRSKFANARWGIIVIALDNGRVICSKDARKLFNPASIQKLLTSMVALDKLGGGFQSKTSLYSKEKIKEGILNADMVLYGRGAPDLNEESLKSLVSQLKQKGLKNLKGDIIGDESFFKGDNLGDGWAWNTTQWHYGAAASALSINRNQITVSLQNGVPKTDSKFVELSSNVKPIEDVEAVGIKRELGTNKIYVWGNGKNLKARIAINNPALFAAKMLKEQLQRKGITINGKAKSIDWKSANAINTRNAIELASIKSSSLAKNIREMNKYSINIHAELILRTLGKRFGYEILDEAPKTKKLWGDDLAGASVIKKWLKDQNIASKKIRIHDGSGLSRLNLVTPEAIGRALIYAAKSKFSNELKNSLPVSGYSGTLRRRLKNVSGKILGKTGSMTYVKSLAGYAKSNNGVIAFVIVCNNATSKADSVKTIDSIASLLAGNETP